jgi:peptide/nickel transport system substrate-binding protein
VTAWDDLQAGLRFGSISRREFLGRAAALGMSTVLATNALAQTPKRGGHLIVALDTASSGDSLDPARFTGSFMQVLGMQFYDTLTQIDERGQVQPWLAETWDAKPGAREWIFKIRKSVTFHNGKELTGADVVYSLNYHRGKESRSAAKALLAAVTDLKATAKNEVAVLLDSGNADLPVLLSDFHLGIGPEGGSFKDAVGTGAYILESFQPGIRARTKRNPNDWQSTRGFVETVETLAINDATARMSALQSGTVHLINRVDPRVAAQLEKNHQIQLFNVSGTEHHTFVMHCDTPPFDNLDLRLALKYAIDRELLVKTVLRGYAKVGNDHPIASFDPFYAADIPQRHYDPDKAKFHFKKSGYGGAPLVLTVGAIYAPTMDAAQLYQANAAKAGIDLQLDRQPTDGYWENVWLKKPFAAAGWSGRATADLMFSLGYASDARWNDTAWKRPAFDKLLVAARAELDTAKRKQMYREMQLMVHEDGGAIVPYFINFLDAGLKRVRGFVPTPTALQSGRRAPERAWFDA